MPVTRWRDPDHPEQTHGGTIVGGLQIGATTRVGPGLIDGPVEPVGASAEARLFAQGVAATTAGIEPPLSSPVPFACDHDGCTYVAKSAAGLGAHRRVHG